MTRRSWLLLLCGVLLAVGILPGATAEYLLYAAGSATGSSDILISAPDGSDRRILIRGGSDPAVSPDGSRIAFVRGRDIWVANVDGTQAMAVTRHGLGIFVRHPSFSADGTRIVFVAGPVTANPLTNIRLVELDGSGEVTVATNGEDPIYTPDGVSIVFTRGREVLSMVTTAMAGPPYTPRQLWAFASGVTVRDPAYSPNARYLTFTLTRNTLAPTPQIRVVDLTQRRERLLASNASQPAFSPDGTQVAFIRNGDLYTMRFDGTRVRRLSNTQAVESRPTWWSTTVPPCR